jgi:hypothetical protein
LTAARPPAAAPAGTPTLRRLTLDELTIDDERAMRGVAAYARLKEAVRRSSHRFLVPDAAAGASLSWDRALFLNLTFWNDAEGTDVLCEARLPADVVAHVAWHHVVGREVARAAGDAPAGPLAMFFAESIASAFDLYLVGRLLAIAPDSDFVDTQVPIMAEAAREAGLADAAFTALTQAVVQEPERAFEELRALLFDAATALLACRDAAGALAVLEGFAGRRFAPLLHHYQLSNWILYARAYGAASPVADAAVRALDGTLRAASGGDSLAWLLDNWLRDD